MLDFFFIFLCFIVVYHHLIFPFILKVKETGNISSPPKTVQEPSITLIIPAYNEENFIAHKIINTAQLKYPKTKLHIVIACDGCSDDTYEIAQKFVQQKQGNPFNIRLLNFVENQGKIAILNQTISESSSDLIVLSDVSADLSPTCLRRLAIHFQNVNVGVVGGTYHFKENGNTSEEIYWQYQRAIKTGEAAFGAPLGMHGACYAFRRELFGPLPPDTINDDFALPMSIVSQGFLGVYDTDIHTVETERTTDTMNWKRRLRISAGNIQQSLRFIHLLSPKFKGISFTFFSGKFLRAWMPFILLSLLGLTLFNALSKEFYQVLLFLQILGLITLFLPLKGPHKIIRIIHALRYLLVGHVAGLIGAVRYLSGFEKTKWKRAP